MGYVVDLETMRTIAPNFSYKEMSCPETGAIYFDPEFLRRLQVFRDIYGKVNVTSGYRSIEYNAKIGGSENSQHCLGRAADIKCSEKQRPKIIKMATDLGFRGIGVYDRHIHLDLRDGFPAFWWGKSK